MSKKSVIIIGAGLAGLSAGCYAQMNGYQSRIFEHHAGPGGVAADWKRNGYTIIGGIHFIMGHHPGQPSYDLYRELGILDHNQFPVLHTYGRFIDEASGISLTITSNLERLNQDLNTLFPADFKIIKELITGARVMQDCPLDMGMDKPSELMSSKDRLKQMWHMRRAYKFYTGNCAKSISEYAQRLQSPLLRRIVKNLFVPEVPVWFILMLLGQLAEGQLGLPEGGSYPFVRAIEQHYTSLGGQLTYCAPVEEILVKNDHAAGVYLADGSRHYADVVISAADGYSTIYKLLGGRYTNSQINERYKNWQLFRPLFMASFGVARDFTDEPHFNVIILRSPLNVGGKEVSKLYLRIANYSDQFAPPGKSSIQIYFKTDWTFWHELQNTDRPGYVAEKERVAQELLSRLEAFYPGITSQVEMTDVATPYTTWRYTLNHQGSYQGWLPTPEVITTQLEKTLPGLANFYMAGQWVMPGGGVTSCLYSGRQVLQLLCHADHREFAR